MQVLFVIRDNYESVGGGDAIQILKTKAALEALGVEITIKKSGEVTQGQIPFYDLAHVFNIQTYESSWAAMQALLLQKRPIALSPIYWDTFDYLTHMAGHERAVWRTLRRLLGQNWFRKFYVRRLHKKHRESTDFKAQKSLLDNADLLLPNSASEGVVLSDLFDGDYAKKVIPIVNAIDVDLYPPKSSSPYLRETFGIENPVLQIGRISSIKNQLRVIEAMFDSAIPLVFIGQTENTEYAEECKRLGAKRGNVYFIERIPHDALPGIYASARVHVLPSWRETPGLVSLEAAAAGCRIVTTSIGSTRDYFGEDAWYVFPDDIAGIKKAILAAYAAPENPAFAQRICTEFTWQRAGEQTLAAYKTVLNV